MTSGNLEENPLIGLSHDKLEELLDQVNTQLTQVEIQLKWTQPGNACYEAAQHEHKLLMQRAERIYEAIPMPLPQP